MLKGKLGGEIDRIACASIRWDEIALQSCWNWNLLGEARQNNHWKLIFELSVWKKILNCIDDNLHSLDNQSNFIQITN